MSRLDILFVWHRTVALYVQSALDGRESLRLHQIEVGDPARCEIGHWIATQGPEVTGLPAWARLVDNHRAYHRIAGRLLRERRAGAHQLDPASRDALQHASAALAEAIGALSAQIEPGAVATHPFWDDHLRIGIRLIDDQHRAIAELATRIARTPDTALDSETGTDFLGDFYRLVAFHFDTEEQLMATADVSPEWCRAHIEEHSALLDRIISYSYEQTHGRGPRHVADIMLDLQRIIVGHVIAYDFGFRTPLQTAP